MWFPTLIITGLPWPIIFYEFREGLSQRRGRDLSQGHPSANAFFEECHFLGTSSSPFIFITWNLEISSDVYPTSLAKWWWGKAKKKKAWKWNLLFFRWIQESHCSFISLSGFLLFMSQFEELTGSHYCSVYWSSQIASSLFRPGYWLFWWRLIWKVINLHAVEP